MSFDLQLESVSEVSSKFKRHCYLEIFKFLVKTKFEGSFKHIREAIALVQWESFFLDSTVLYDCLEFKIGDRTILSGLSHEQLLEFGELVGKMLHFYEDLVEAQKQLKVSSEPKEHYSFRDHSRFTKFGNFFSQAPQHSSSQMFHGLTREDIPAGFDMCIPNSGEPIKLNRKRGHENDSISESNSPLKKVKKEQM